MTGPESPLVDRLFKPLQDFLQLESAGGLILMAASLLALGLANSPWQGHYVALLDLPVQVSVGDSGIAKPLLLWINDGLMAVFFFLIGLELKREVLEGHLSSWRRASLPAIAALGGMAVPALFYAALNRGDAQAMRGWAIPTATDIAFALGVLSLLGNRVPAALKAFLLSVAIFDDLGAIIVIALFYTAELSLLSLLVASAVTAALAGLNRFGVTRSAAYVVLGVVLWVAMLKSGVHATLAGVLLALFIPMKTRSGQSLLTGLEHTLHPWVAFAVLPLFAFANAGIPLLGLTLADTLHPVPLGIALGLVIGKPLGVMLSCWLAVRLRVADLPDQVGYRQLWGAALLCGIGFTMSLFIASLAFEQGDGNYFGLERLGILLGTAVSGVLGYAVLRVTLPDMPARSHPD